MLNCKLFLTIQRLYDPFLLAALLNDSKVKRCRIGEFVFIFGCDVDGVIVEAHGLTCSGQYRTVIIEVLHLKSYGPCGCFIGPV